MPEEQAGTTSPGGNRGTGPQGDAGAAGAELGQAEVNQKLRRMASLSRHDINNQLTILSGYLSLLESGSSAMKTAEIVRILQGATDRIQLILRFTKDYQEIGASPPEWQDLGETVLAARALADTGPVTVAIGEGCRQVGVLADPLFVKAFTSLIDNTLRHGKGATAIRVDCRREGPDLVIGYEDNGCGIPAAVRPVLFEPGKGKKTGYGLFLVRDILGITGMTIAETGQEGTGVRFRIVVPAGCFRAPA